MAWAKLHTEILGDPKLMRAARKGARELVFLPWLIAFAKQADDSGRLTVGSEPAEAADIAPLIPGATTKAVALALASLETIGVLARDDDALRFTRWDVRSESKPSDSPSAIGERVKRLRDKKRKAEAVTTGNALPETPCNALHVTPDNATEKRREEEKRGEESADAIPPPPWVSILRARWVSAVGRIGAIAIRRELGGSVAVHGEEAVLGAISAYAAARLLAGKPMKLEWFAAEIVGYIRRAAEDDEPLVTDGWLTTHGDKVTR